MGERPVRVGQYRDQVMAIEMMELAYDNLNKQRLLDWAWLQKGVGGRSRIRESD